MQQSPAYTMSDILSILPHRPPFLFVDRVLKLAPEKLIVTDRLLRADEPHFAGHFPHKPIMPGVLVADALAQTSGLLWGLSLKANSKTPRAPGAIFFLAAATMKFTSPAFPGETMEMTSSLDRRFGDFLTFTVEAYAKRKTIAKGTLTLAMTAEPAL